MKSAIAILLASLALLANIGLSHSTHYCQGEAVASALAIHQPAQMSCCASLDMAPCRAPDTHSPRDHSDDCCENDQQIIELSDNIPTHFQWSPDAQTTVVALFWVEAIFLQMGAAPYRVGDLPHYYSPPPPWRDYQAWSQVFQI